MNQEPQEHGYDSPEPGERAILEQLERVLSHPAFKNSRRSQALLRYIVEHQGASGDGHLKERTLGGEVFGREASYDTNADPVVRIVAGEVRKRIAQYYHEPGHEGEIRIELPLGSYRPEFHAPAAPPAGLTNVEGPAPGLPMVHTPRRPRLWMYTLPGLVLAGVIGVVAWGPLGRRRTPPPVPATANSAINRFWRPILNTVGPVQIGVGPKPGVVAGPPNEELASDLGSGTMQPVGWWDFLVANNVSGLVQRSGRGVRIESEAATNLRVLSQGPAVLIGANNNSWVMKLTQGLRFHFVEENRNIWIVDRDAPGKKYVASLGAVPGSVLKYALIARLSDPTTGQNLVILAGAGSPATYFAGEVATDADVMEALARQLPKGWETKNIEVVVSGQAVNGQPGAARVVATYVW